MIATVLVAVLAMTGVLAARHQSDPETAGTLLSDVTLALDAPPGLSGLDLADDARDFLSVSDRGELVTGRIDRDESGRMVGAHVTGHTRFLDNSFQPAEGFHSDSEAIRRAADGSVIVSFEGYARVARFLPPDMKPRQLNFWDRFNDIWGNEGMESLAIAPDNIIITLLEQVGPEGYRSLLYRGGITWTDGPVLRTDGRFHATDADYGPDGRLYVLERRLTLIRGMKSRISVYTPEPGGFSAPATVLETAYGAFPDFEGLSVRKRADGHMIATVVSDNNMRPGVAGMLAEFDLSP